MQDDPFTKLSRAERRHIKVGQVPHLCARTGTICLCILRQRACPGARRDTRRYARAVGSHPIPSSLPILGLWECAPAAGQHAGRPGSRGCHVINRGRHVGRGVQGAVEAQAAQAAGRARQRPQGRGAMTSNYFLAIFAHFLAPPHHIRDLCYAPLRARADRVLISAWNPTLCPIRGFRCSRSGHPDPQSPGRAARTRARTRPIRTICCCSQPGTAGLPVSPARCPAPALCRCCVCAVSVLCMRVWMRVCMCPCNALA